MVVDQSEGSLLNSGTDSRLVDRFSVSKDYALKARKPYTITKQRERWTQEEHIKFLEALKLYGRSWRQIEEHVGNKTAVQIRSHAQKFFSKVVREPSGADGTELGTIDIPPPRAKRKPTHPYPRNVSSPLKKRADPMRFTSHDTSSSNHESTSPSSPESPSTQSLKLFGKTVYVTGSTRPLSVDTITSLPCNLMPTLAPEFQATGGLSVYGDLVFCSARPRDGIEPMIKCCSQDGKNGEFGNKGDRYARGFVPYKRCLTEESSMITGEEREELRVRLCL